MIAGSFGRTEGNNGWLMFAGRGRCLFPAALLRQHPSEHIALAQANYAPSVSEQNHFSSEPPAPWKANAESTQADYDADAPCVLLIEDNAGDVFIVQEALQENNVRCELTVISDGESALQYFDRLDGSTDLPCPCLVLLDLNLPKRSGHDVLRRIRRGGRCSSIPIVVVSSSDSERDLSENKRLGATAYFRKPSTLEQYLRIGRLVKDLIE